MSESKTTADTLCHICGIRLGDEGMATCSAAHGPRFWPASVAAERKRLEGGGSHWDFHEGMVRLQLWTLDETGQPSPDPTTVWMTPGQAMELIEGGARSTRLALKGLTHG